MRWRQTPRRRGLGPSGRAYGAKRGACRRDEQRAKRTIHYSRGAAVACGYDYSLAVKKDGTLWAWGHNYVGQLGLGDTTNRLTPTDLTPAMQSRLRAWFSTEQEEAGPALSWLEIGPRHCY